MCPRKQTTDPKLLILVSFFSGEVLPHTLIPVIASTYCGKYPISFFLGHPVYTVVGFCVMAATLLIYSTIHAERKLASVCNMIQTKHLYTVRINKKFALLKSPPPPPPPYKYFKIFFRQFPYMWVAMGLFYQMIPKI